MSNIPSISELYDLDHTIAKALFLRHTYPWEVLKELKAFILALGETLPTDEYDHPEEGVWIAKDAKVFPSAYIGAPCIIDHGAEIRHCAFIRGSAIIGKNSVFGNSCEIKNSIIFDDAQTPHYNYVGARARSPRMSRATGRTSSSAAARRPPRPAPTRSARCSVILSRSAATAC